MASKYFEIFGVEIVVFMLFLWFVKSQIFLYIYIVKGNLVFQEAKNIFADDENFNLFMKKDKDAHCRPKLN